MQNSFTKGIEKKSFWLYIYAIIAIIVLEFFGTIDWIKNEPNTNKIDIIKINLLDIVWGSILAILLFKLYNFFKKLELNSYLIIFYTLSACYITGVLYQTASNFDAYLVFVPHVFYFDPECISIVSFFKSIQVVAITGIYYITDHWTNLQLQKEIALKATNLAQEAHLKMLRYQLNPHFLFNTLNSLRALIIQDQSKAMYMVTELSKFLRYSLECENKLMVKVNDEIETVKNYLEIQKIRFNNKFIFEICISKEANDCIIPCFIIHPLIENAVKYGMKTSTLPLIINLTSYVENNSLFIKVVNSGRIYREEGTHNDSGTGTGLKNIINRLENIYTNNYSFSLYETNGSVNTNIEIKNLADNKLEIIKNRNSDNDKEI